MSNAVIDPAQGHDAVMAETIRTFEGALNRGTVLVSATLEEPHLLVGVVEEVADATGAAARTLGAYTGGDADA